MCVFPAVSHDHELVLTTCTNGRETTWDRALARGYTLMPKPYLHQAPELLRAPSRVTTAVRVWRSRDRPKGLIAAYRAERSRAIEATQRENERRLEDEAAQRRWQQQRDHAARAFRERHR